MFGFWDFMIVLKKSTIAIFNPMVEFFHRGLRHGIPIFFEILKLCPKRPNQGSFSSQFENRDLWKASIDYLLCNSHNFLVRFWIIKWSNKGSRPKKKLDFEAKFLIRGHPHKLKSLNSRLFLVFNLVTTIFRSFTFGFCKSRCLSLYKRKILTVNFYCLILLKASENRNRAGI